MIRAAPRGARFTSRRRRIPRCCRCRSRRRWCRRNAASAGARCSGARSAAWSCSASVSASPSLIEDLFARSEGLGFLGLAFAFAATLALIVVVAREALGLARLAAIEKLHLRAAAVLASDDRAESRTIVQELLKLAHQNPHLARARTALQRHADDIIDGADMIRLAERE